MILANGKFPGKKSSIELITASDFLICCDGAASKILDLDIEPDIIIGDMDSIDDATLDKLSDRIKEINDQSSNDLSKALKWLINKNIDSVIVLGADGLRDDHSLSNILLFLENSYPYKINIITDHGEFDVINTSLLEPHGGLYSQSFSSFKGQGVSVFCSDRQSTFQSTGLRYKLENFSFDKLYGAALNVSKGSHFSIACDSDNTNILVYRADEETR